ncbi:MAG: amidohydrolase [Bryobacteraceae bacterium]|nr:amidohydrolase [Bryobacteraceae bacterium]
MSDAHVHFFSHRFYSGLARQKGVEIAEALGPMLGWEIPPEDPKKLANRWVAELDLNAVRRACLIASAPGDEESVSVAVSAFPDRFFGYFMLDPMQSSAMERVEAAARSPHFHGICLFPAMHLYPMTAPQLLPILQIASESGLAIFVHCGTISVGVRKKLGLPGAFDMGFSNPLDLHSVALRFPNIPFIVPHFGAGLFREALMLADLCPNVYLDTSSSNGWMKYEGLDLASVFRRALNVVGAGRLLFGTDSSFFPRGWHSAIFAHQTAVMEEIGLGHEEMRQILGLNLERILRSPKL